MHFMLMVVSDDKLTPKVLQRRLPSICEEHDVDSWGLGGRYTGILNAPVGTPGTFKGEPDSNENLEFEKTLKDMGLEMGLDFARADAQVSPGVDIAQAKQLPRHKPLFDRDQMPGAVLLNWEWYEGFDDEEWFAKWCDMLRRVQPQQWLAVVDCHR
jgi:hypothetical protein